MSLLEGITGPRDLDALDAEQLVQLAAEIREFGELLFAENVEVARTRDRRQQAHTASLIVATRVLLRVDAGRDDHD